ncbi:MAG: tRNA 2-thiouridine(34) synthase MnmA [Sedimentisphaerales bacterium]|nr:tRNA 2-thiouridine(34) synthase MnmA [Sedimentisphaerales bacterium]
MKPGHGKKVLIALSGGVDSSTATALLCREGFECAGVFMITNESACHAQADAEAVAGKLGIKLHVLDLRGDFEQILDYFCNEYKRGRTPNPCVFCNRLIKFGKLWDFAQRQGAEFLATGHYARICRHDRSVGLYEAVNAAKDQSYVLTMIDKDVLPNILLPMGDYSKEQTRQMAAEFGLGTEHQEESQEICFIPEDDYVAVLEQRCPELVRKGNIVDRAGKILGEHNGVHRYTIGQRRGLRIAMGIPYYVTGIDAGSNTVTLGPKEEVMSTQFRAAGVNWLVEEPASPFRAKVRIRYNDKGASATVIPQNNAATVEFGGPTSAITPGQLAAFYIQEESRSRLIGGGWIDNVMG